MITLTLAAILVVALFAHFSGQPEADERGMLVRALETRAAVVVVFATTFVVLWYSWAAWNPIAVVHDEMAYVLQAQIFARGRWALPSPPLPAFWEQPHVLVEPVLAAKYFPGHALAMSLGALVGWPALMPLVMQSSIAALLFVLARRVASGGVAFLACIIWLFSLMVLVFGPTYFSESTTTICWMAGWYALLAWRTTRTRSWLLAVAFCTGWCAIARPLTGLAFAIPIGVVVLRDIVAERRWKDLFFAIAVGVAVMAILPLWSVLTTGDWRVTPWTVYTRMYMPYDVPGFGMNTTPPTHTITSDLARLNDAYSSAHKTHVPSALLATLGARTSHLIFSVWGGTSGILAVFALPGLRTLVSATAFAVASSVLLLVVYLVYATPAPWTLYYYESVPAYALLTAAGMAWAASLIGRPRLHPFSRSFAWSSPRWTRALVAGALVLVLPGLVTLQLIRGRHIGERKALTAFNRLLASIHDPRAVVFVRYTATHDPHKSFVRNTADPQAERIWVVYDRGERENARLRARAPDRTAYLFDESMGRIYQYDPSGVK